MHLRANAELCIVTCIHRTDNITPVINLLAASSPFGDSPIALHVLRLVELVGWASPLFISHKLQKKRMDSQSFTSEPVILAFTQFERRNRDAVSANLFNAISPPKLMHADVCTLALDKLASLIILPFHRQWTGAHDGSAAWEDRNVRALNCSVLDISPCSVAILVDLAPPSQQP